jgi:DNA-binding Lrp family transcriptional regulator
MSTGFVFISTAPTKEHNVFSALSMMKEIIEVHPLFGEYDLIVKIEAKDFEELGQIVIKCIRTLDGVVDTKTLPGIEF